MTGTIALSWGPWGGFYIRWGFCKRLCLGWLALTYVPIELDDLMEAFARPLSDEEVWNLDHALAETIAYGVARLREMDRGHPIAVTAEEWHAIQDEIAETFAAYAEHEDPRWLFDHERLARAFDLLEKWFPDLWD